jgi:polysaccharide biosynthesis PFTS motif protein
MIIVSQYLIEKNGILKLNKAIKKYYGGNKDLILAMPKEWQDIIINNNIPVNKNISIILWNLYLVSKILKGVILAIKCIFITNCNRNKINQISQNYTFFFNLNKENIGASTSGNNNYNFANWYKKSTYFKNYSKTLFHDNKLLKGSSDTVEYINSPWLMINGVEMRFKLIIWIAKSLPKVIWNLLLGRWYEALLFEEVFKSKVVSINNFFNYSGYFLFPFSNNIYRPLWTYEVEKKGAKVICYFYSTYSDVALSENHQSDTKKWKVMTWPSYLVWDKYQSLELKKRIDEKVQTKIVGPIYFTDIDDEYINIIDKSIIIFDISPSRSPASMGFSGYDELLSKYKNFNTHFIRDICKVATKIGFNVYIKKKREIGKNSSKKYDYYIKKLCENDNINLIDKADLSPVKFINSCYASISAPFTSTAVIAKHKNKNSIYYDPSMILNKNHSDAHEVPIISGIDELELWMKKINLEFMLNDIKII